MSQLNQIIAAASATVGAFGLGTVLSWTSPALPDIEEHSDRFKDLTDEEKSWIGAVLSLGALFSAPVCGFLMDKIGRKNTMLILSVPFVLGWLLIGYAQNYAMMIIGRFVSGFCGGGFSLVAPVFIGETSEDSIRGALGSAFQLMVVLGILFVYVLGTFVNWQWLALICGFVPLVFLVAMIFVPESPRYLLMTGKHAEASQSLCWFRKKPSSQDVEDELRIMEMSVNEQKAHKSKFSDLLLPFNLKPALIMMGLMLFQQLSGINAVIFYTVTIFESAGSTMNTNLSTIIVGIVQVVATLAAVFVVDRLGRRILLLISDLVMCISLICLGLYFKLKDDDKAESIGWLPLVSLMTFVVAFSVGFGPLPWMMLGELLPPKIKGLTASIATMFNWFLSFLVTKFFSNVLTAVGDAWCYWGFAIVCAIGFVFVFVAVPETKGKTIEEIQRHFGGGLEISVEDGNANRSAEDKKQ